MKTSFTYGIQFFKYVCVASLVIACGDSADLPPGTGANPGGNNNGGPTGWAIPQDQVFDGGPGKDGIPALENPKLINASAVTFLDDDDLVLGYKNGNEVRAYPHPILDWHEIINDKVGDHTFAVTYCPLTGTGIGWDRIIDGKETTFGVSGLLFNSNLLPYDRETDSNWSQMRLDCVNGELLGTKIETFNLVETTWDTWKAMYPQTKVVSTETGFSRNYSRYPYGDYKTNNSNLIFPVSPTDNRLPAKERVLGIFVDGKVKAYRFNILIGDPGIREDVFLGKELIIAGSVQKNFVTAFERKLDDGTLLTFTSSSWDPTISEIIMTDNEGNSWNVFGEAVAGPRVGQKLVPIKGFIGYWFSWGAFYPEIEVFGM
jgi:hypothetical protein